jgi:tetratricopeptide (TPR) repeat protein
MTLDRLSELQDRLDRQYRILKGFENEKDESGPGEKAKLQLKIDDLLKEIQPVEKEYTERISRSLEQQGLPESIAGLVVLELLNEIEIFLKISTDIKVKSSLEAILLELENDEISALEKLKAVIPKISEIVINTPENETEGFARKLFPTLKKTYKSSELSFFFQSKITALKDYFERAKKVLESNGISPEKQAIFSQETIKRTLFLSGGSVIAICGISYLYLSSTCRWEFEKKDYNDSVSACSKALLIHPFNSRLYYWRGLSKQALLNYKEAVDDFQKAVELNAEYSAAYYHNGLVKRSLKDFPGALEALGLSIEKDNSWEENSYENYFGKASALYARARLHAGFDGNSTSNYSQAMRDYDQSIEIKKDYGVVYIDRGVLRYNRGEYREAIEDYSKAISLNSTEIWVAYGNRAQAEADVGDFESARKDYGLSILAKSDYAWSFGRRGELSLKEKDYFSAESDFSDALAINGKDTYSYKGRGKAFDGMANYRRAIEDYTKAIKYDSKDAEAYYLRCLTKEGLDNLSALDDCRTASDMYRQQSNPTQASKAAEKASQLSVSINRIITNDEIKSSKQR